MKFLEREISVDFGVGVLIEVIKRDGVAGWMLVGNCLYLKNRILFVF